MTLTDPRESLAKQSNFIGYLMGLTSIASVVHALAAKDIRPSDPPQEADDFIHLLLGLASVGEAVERLAVAPPPPPTSTASTTEHMRWLR